MRKLTLIPQSWHFRDRHLLKEQLVSQLQGRRLHGIGIWNIFNLVFGSYRGLFKSSDDNARSGIVNLFCTRDDKYEPYTFFVRLHILVRLRDSINEATNIGIKQIQEEYREIFGNNLSFYRVFCRAIYRLIQSALVCTRSCRRYKTLDEVQEHIDSDYIYISEAGLYYLNRLIKKIDYFFFMKDDIDWPDDFDLSDIEYAKVGMSRIRRHKSALRALRLLATLEMRMLKEIRDLLTSVGDAQIIKNYVALFSGQRVSGGGGDITFTGNMFYEYKRYLMWSVDNHEKEFEEEYIEINSLFEDYDEIRKSFLEKAHNKKF